MPTSVQLLQEAARQIGRGNFGHRVDLAADDELAGLAGQFNEMAARLGQSHAALERRVEDRERELSEALGQQTATADVLRIISRSPSELQPVLDAIVQTAARLCSSEYAFIVTCADKLCRLVAANNVELDHIQYLSRNPIPIDRNSVTGRTALECRTIHVTDVLADPEFRRPDWQKVGRQRTVLGVPLAREGALLGVIILARTEVRPFSERQIELITTFASQAVIAIENARLHEQVQARTRELTEALEYQTATSDVLNVISRSPTQVQPVLDVIVNTAARLCAAEYSYIGKYQNGVLRYVAHVHVSDEHLRFLADPISIDRGAVIGRVAIEKRAIHVPDVLADPEFDRFEWQSVSKQRTVLGVPLLREGELIGVIILARTAVAPFTEKQIELLSTFADQAVIAIENARLFDEVQARNHDLIEALEQQTATADILRVISNSPTHVQPVFETIAESAVRLCEGQFCFVYRFDGKLIHYAAQHGLSPEAVEEVHRTYPMPPGRRGAVARAIQGGTVEHIQDVLADPEYGLGELAIVTGYRSVVAVPLLRDGRSIGAIAVTRSQAGSFPDRQVELLKTFADQAVIAISNVGLFKDLQARTAELSEALEYQTATSDVLNVISRSPDRLQPVLDTIVETAARICRARIADIVLADGDRMHVRASFGEFGRPVSEALPLDRSSVMGRSIIDKVPVHVTDLQDPGHDFALGRQLALQYGHRTILGVPLIRQNRALGTILLRRATVEPFSDRQIALLKTFADQAVIAISNVGLFEDLQARTAELSEALEYQTATSDVLNVISRSPSQLQPVLDALVETASRLCEAEQAMVFRFDGSKYGLVASHGYSREFTDYMERHPVVPGRGTAVGRTALERKPVHIRDVLADPDYGFPEGQKLGGWRTSLAVPLLREGEPIGAFSLNRRKVRPFTGKQIDLVTTFADQAVIAIENVRLFEEVQARTRELQESLDYQTATSEVLNVISRSPSDIQPVLDAIAETAVRLCGANRAFIHRYDGAVLPLAASHNASPELTDYVKRHPIAPGRHSGVARAALEKRTIHIPDVRTDPEYTFGAAQVDPIRTVLAVPMLKAGELVGVIVIYRLEVQPFSAKQIDLITTFADQAVIAIENVRLFEEVQARTRELQEALQYQTATSEVLSVISRSPSQLQPVADSIVEIAGRLCEADYAVIFQLQEDGRYHLIAANRAEAEFIKYLRARPILPGRNTTTGRAALERRTVHVHDVLADPEYTAVEMALHGAYRSNMAVPLLREGVAVGVITVVHKEVKPFTTKQIELVTTFADQAVIAIENVRLFEEVQARTRELQESLEQQTATADVLGVISRSTTDLQPVFSSIASTAVRLCQADYAHIYKLAEDGNYYLAEAKGVDQDYSGPLFGTPFPPGRGSLAARAALERRTVHIPNIPEDPEYTLRIGKQRSGLGVPLLRGGSPIGVIVLLRTEVRPFTERQIELVTTFADQAVIAIENVRLFEEVQARTAELQNSLDFQTAIADVLNVISRSKFELQPVLDALVGSAARLCLAENGFIFLRDGDVFRIVANHCFSPEFGRFLAEHPITLDRGTLTGRTALEQRVVHIPDVLEDCEFTSLESVRLGRFRTMLGVPLMRDGAVVGVIALTRSVAEPFTEGQIELVKTFADQAVIAIENARLMRELREQSDALATSVEELKALREMGEAVSSTLDLTVVMDTIAQRAVELGQGHGCALFRYDKSQREFSLWRSVGLPAEAVAKLKSLRIREGETAMGRAIATRGPISVPDLHDAPSFPLRDATIALGLRSALVVPLLRAERAFGAMVLWRREVGPFAARTVDLMQTFANQSVLAIQNARLFREIEAKSRELEVASRHKSQFLANMSHELRTPMNAVLGFTEMMADGLYGPLPDKALKALERVQANGKHLLGLINDVLDLSKIEAGQLTLAVDDYSLGQVVQTVMSGTESLAKAKGLALTASVQEGLPLGRADERRLTQVLLNLVGNAIKFTNEGSVSISARAEGNVFEIAVRDTGPGIAADDQKRIFEEFQQVDNSSTRKKGGTGLGLAISKRLIEMHGGTLTVQSVLGEGSTFIVLVPIRAEERMEAA